MHINSIESIRFREAELPAGRDRHFTKRVCLGVCTQYFLPYWCCYSVLSTRAVTAYRKWALSLCITPNTILFRGMYLQSRFLYWAAYRRQLGYPSCEVFEKLSLLQGRQGDTCVWVFLPIAARTCFRIFCLFVFYFCQIHEMFNCWLNKMTNFCNGLFNFGHGQIL